MTCVPATRRRELADRLLDGYVHGPAAATEGTAQALVKAAAADAVVLVEGISDQIAVETLAGRQGRDLGAEGVVVVPTGGAHTVTRYLLRFGPAGAGLRLAGLCDLGEEDVFRRGLDRAGLGSLRSLQRQPNWRDQPAAAQLRRFLGSGARRKLRYARLLAGAADLDRLPRPLDALLTESNPRSPA
jgi:hypothetical protein